MSQFNNLTETYKKNSALFLLLSNAKYWLKTEKKEVFVLFQELRSVTLEINE
jgi:3-methyladenine DNA glycosylase AlkC